MNLFVRGISQDHVLRRKSETYGLLEEVCQALEPTDTQYELAKTSYEAVADWLSRSDNPALRNLTLYPHGSIGLGTTIRPLAREDFDVDLICLIYGIDRSTPPATLKQLIGNRLREHGVYSGMLEEKKRCWRLDYKRAFHLDISPTIINSACPNGGELVPDRALKSWKPTNPAGYKNLFERRCLLRPRFAISKSIASDSAISADIEAFPKRKLRRGILRRIVQMLKRHRDIFFQNVQAEIAPISIVITTLAAQSYEYCVKAFEFETELDVVVATIRLMPHFIERPIHSGRTIYLIANETTEGENFAERWNTEPERAAAFHRWHQRALYDFENLASVEGEDVVAGSVASALGNGVVSKVMDARSLAISQAREARRLFVAPAIGLSLSKSAGAVEVPRNTHFGDPPK